MIDSLQSDTARVVDVDELPPAADGREYRFEVTLVLEDSDEPPTESDVREIADGVLEEIETIQDSNWPGADELYIQVYGPDGTDGGACGTAHWVHGEFESVESRPYLF